MGSKNAYIFRGPPASGKGTLSREFIKTLKGKVAFLELDNFRWGIHSYNRQIPDDFTDDDHKLAYKNFLSVLENYCENGTYTLVLDGFFSWSKLNPHGSMSQMIPILKKYKFYYYPFLLQADLETLWQRNNKREYVTPRKEFEMLYRNVMDEINKQEIKIDVGKFSTDQALEEILKATV